MKPEIFATVWQDGALGPLHLKYPDGEAAVHNAQAIAAKGKGKVWHVRAVHLSADDVLTDLIEPLNT